MMSTYKSRLQEIADEDKSPYFQAVARGAIGHIDNLTYELANLRAENERLREAFTKPDQEILAKVCYGVNCYPDELADMLETYWEALK